MNKLMTDIKYIQIMNELGNYLINEYGLTQSEIQAVKHKIHLVIEEITDDR